MNVEAIKSFSSNSMEIKCLMEFVKGEKKLLADDADEENANFVFDVLMTK